MKKLFFTVINIFFLINFSNGQSDQFYYQGWEKNLTWPESFEYAFFPPVGWTTISPAGGTGWYSLSTGTSPVPGFNNGMITAPFGGGSKIAFCNYLSGCTTMGTNTDQWLITPRISGILNSDYLTFRLKRFSLYGDRIEILVSEQDSAIASFSHILDTISFNSGEGDTIWNKYVYSLAQFGGQDIFLAFRESVDDNTGNGAAIMLDLVYVGPDTGFSVPGSCQGAGNVKIFPNPAHDKLFVSFPLINDALFSFTITDLTGRIYLTGKSGVPGSDMVIDLRHFLSGIYIIRIFNDELSGVRRFIVY